MTGVCSSLILEFMEEYRNKRETVGHDQIKSEPAESDLIKDASSYPASIEEMSEKWRSIQREGRQGDSNDQRSIVERHYLAVGLVIGLLVIAFLIVVGGFIFLVWNAH